MQLGCAVKKVSRDNEQWRIDYSYENLTKYEIFDVVFVCNGHYVKPYIPQIGGSFDGPLIHSHNYRNPRPYKDQKVAVIGAGPSGIDIMLQLADVAEKVSLCLHFPEVYGYLFCISLQHCYSLLNASTAFFSIIEYYSSVIFYEHYLYFYHLWKLP